MTREDEKELARFRERERGELIDNCYRARLIPDYMSCTLDTETLRKKWSKFIDDMQGRPDET